MFVCVCSVFVIWVSGFTSSVVFVSDREKHIMYAVTSTLIYALAHMHPARSVQGPRIPKNPFHRNYSSLSCCFEAQTTIRTMGKFICVVEENTAKWVGPTTAKETRKVSNFAVFFLRVV